MEIEVDTQECTANLESQTPNTHMCKPMADKDAAEEIPKLTHSGRLALFGGDNDLLVYYLGIREATAKAAENGVQCFCDPKDANMVNRLKLEGWCPKVALKDMKDGGEERDLGLSSKQMALDEKAEENDSEDDFVHGDKERNLNESGTGKENDIKSFVCGVQGCSAQFTSLASHESHYHASHNFVCHVCRRVFVSNFLLDIHLEENHDSYFQVLCPRIDMYRCLVESCSLKFRTADLRKDHLVTVHKFPAPFSFHRPINHKPHKSKSSKKKNREGKPKESNKNVMEISDVNPHQVLPLATNPEPGSPAAHPASSLSDEMEVDMKSAGLENGNGSHNPQHFRGQQSSRGKSAAKRGRGRGGRVPPTICFGRGSQRAFQHQPRGRGRHWHQTQGMDVDTTVDIEKVNFTDLIESLES